MIDASNLTIDLEQTAAGGQFTVNFGEHRQGAVFAFRFLHDKECTIAEVVMEVRHHLYALDFLHAHCRVKGRQLCSWSRPPRGVHRHQWQNWPAR
jgi:hypothetical protein